ncbi:MAG: hypothetical protein ABIJ40_07285 [Bacteroidota bacterium]
MVPIWVSVVISFICLVAAFLIRGFIAEKAERGLLNKISENHKCSLGKLAEDRSVIESLRRDVKLLKSERQLLEKVYHQLKDYCKLQNMKIAELEKADCGCKKIFSKAN